MTQHGRLDNTRSTVSLGAFARQERFSGHGLPLQDSGQQPDHGPTDVAIAAVLEDRVADLGAQFGGQLDGAGEGHPLSFQR